jgi:hypothetical protein
MSEASSFTIEEYVESADAEIEAPTNHPASATDIHCGLILPSISLLDFRDIRRLNEATLYNALCTEQEVEGGNSRSHNGWPH